MQNTQSLLSAQQLIAVRHRGSVLSAAFGFDFAVKHALDHAIHAWTTECTTSSNSWASLDDFIRASCHDFSEKDHTPHGLPMNSLPFFAWGHLTFDAYTFQTRTASWWHLLDMVATNPSRIVPSTLFVPYARTSINRSGHAVQGFRRVSLWFIRRDGGLGVPVEGNRPLLWHGEKEFRRSDGTWRKTMKVKISWPGYDGWWEKQVRLESDTGDRSVGRLANVVVNKVRDFIDDHDPSAGHPIGTRARWRIGSQPGRISSRDVIVLGIILVSDGAAMPILQVRDDFVFVA